MSDDKTLRADLNAAIKKVEVLDTVIAALKKSDTNKGKEIDTLKNKVAALEKPTKKEEKPKPKAVLSPVTIGDDKYKFAYPAWYDGNVKVLASDIKDDEEALAEQLEKNPSVFVAV